MPAEKEILSIIGANIRTIRKAQGLTQQQVEVGAGLAENNLSLIELGEVEIGLTKAIRIATYLKVQLSDLYKI